MMTIYLEFPQTYAEIMAVVNKFAYKSYPDVSDTVDYYLEQLIRLEVMRRKYHIEYGVLHDVFSDVVRKHPILTRDDADYFNITSIELYLHGSKKLWQSVAEELTTVPNSEFLLWHVDHGIWKMYTVGVTHVGK